MTPKEWVDLARILPAVLWFLLAALIIWKLWPTIKGDVMPRLSGVKALGVELTFARAQLDQAAQRVLARQRVDVSVDDRSQVLRRAASAAKVLAGMRILWVDDNPMNNANEVHLFNSLGVYVDQVTSTKEALTRLAAEKYDTVVSDIEREGEPDAGIRMAAEAWERHLYRWTIYYVGRLDQAKGAPPLAFGITNRPDHLLHYVIDVAERERL